METKDIIAKMKDLKEYDLIIERNSEIEPLWNQLQKGEISGQEYHDKYNIILEKYDKKIREVK